MIENNNDNNNLKPNYFNSLNDSNIDSFIEYFKNPENEAWNDRNEENGSSYLHTLIEKDFIEQLYQVINIAKQIINKKDFEDFLNAPNNKGMTPFHFSCYKGNMKLIKFFLNNGINKLLKSKKGLSCIHYSAITNKVTPIYYMIEQNGIRVEETDDTGNTFYHWACYTASEKIMDFFLNDKKYLKLINLQNNDGYIPLQYYIMTKNKRLIKRLILYGVDPYIKNNKGENSFDIVNKIYKDDIENKKKLNEILRRKYYINIQFWFFIFFHFIYPFLIILFEFPFINYKYFPLILTIYILFTVFIFGFIIYFLKKDPGFLKSNSKDYLKELIEEDNENNIDISNYCIKCQILKDYNTRHCYYCDKCVKKFDHHCRWVNKCVGNNNIDLYDKLIFLLLGYNFFNFILCLFANANKNKTIINFKDFLNYIIFGHTNIANTIKIFLFVLYFLFFLGFSVIILPIIKFIYQQKYYSNNIYDITYLKNENLVENTQDNEEATSLLPYKE